MFKDERVVAEGTVFFSIYDGDDPEKKPILKLSSKKTAKVITALLNADREQRCRFSLACHPPIIDLKCKKCGWRSR